MFGISKKNKQKKIENIDSFPKAIKAIKFFIATYDWENALESIEKLKILEKQSYLKLNKELSDEDLMTGKEQNKQKKLFDKKLTEISKIENIYEKEKKKYDFKLDKDRFKVRFKQIKIEINNLISNSKAKTALSLLQNFLEENKNKQIIINFFNKEKKKIQKAIIREDRNENIKFKESAKLEALKLIGKTTNLDEDSKDDKNENTEKPKFFEVIKIYHKIQKKLKRKKLLDEVNLLIEENSKIKDDIAKHKLETIHKGLTKEIEEESMNGYNLFGKILGADKIVGDTFGYNENKNKYNFFIGDATGTGIRAGFIVTLLSRLFNKYVDNTSFNKLIFEINNGLKQDLKSRNFVTGIYFEILRKETNIIRYIGMGHEPMLIYRHDDKKVETIIPGGLAAGIRIMKNETEVKEKEIIVKDGDILLTYSDGLTANKSPEGEYYNITKLQNSFHKIASINSNPRTIYDGLLKDIKIFKGGAQFTDDVTILLLQRDEDKDIIDDKENFIKSLKTSGGITNTDFKKIKGTTKEEIEKELKEIEKEKKTKNIVKILENLYYTGETLKLKQEAIKYIKEGYIDKKINFYLKKALANEQQYKIDQKEQRVRNKYNVLKELMKKGDYKTVMNEAENIISKDGNI